MTDETQQTTQAVATVAEITAFTLSGPQLAALVSAAAQLVLEVEAIRANAVAAWGHVSTDFAAAADAWTAAGETPTAQTVLAPGHFNDARLSGQTAVAAPAPTAATIVTAPAVAVSLGDGVVQG